MAKPIDSSIDRCIGQDPGLKTALSRVAVGKLEETTAQQVRGEAAGGWRPILKGSVGHYSGRIDLFQNSSCWYRWSSRVYGSAWWFTHIFCGSPKSLNGHKRYHVMLCFIVWAEHVIVSPNSCDALSVAVCLLQGFESSVTRQQHVDADGILVKTHTPFEIIPLKRSKNDWLRVTRWPFS